jgi:hypothetical protein
MAKLNGLWIHGRGKRQEPVVKNVPVGKIKEIELIDDRKLM